MGVLSRDKRRELIAKYMLKKFSTKFIGEINKHDRTEFCRDVFRYVGRNIRKDWTYKNSNQKIPFTYFGRANWEGINSKQEWNKFIQGKESQYHSLEINEKINLIRNHLKNEFNYNEVDKLDNEISRESKVKNQKISIYCPKHKWIEDLNLSSVLWKANEFICPKCAKEFASNKLRLSISEIKKEWDKLERIVDGDFKYVNNMTPISFYSKKFDWGAEQTWNSYKQNKSKGSNDPQDLRCLTNKKGYLIRELEKYNEKNKTKYKINPDWNIKDNIGPKSEIQLLDPDFKNHIAYMNWYDFFVLKQTPILKSLKENQSSYIREFAKDTGRIISKSWVYSNDAHELIKFTSNNKIYDGVIFANSWNQISNGSGYSIQSMVNKKEFYTPMFEDLNFELRNEIDNKKSFSQKIKATCEEGHFINRSLISFKNSPEGFCTRCNEKSPDDLNSFLKSEKKRNQRAYIYYCNLTDREGNLSKKIGITKFKKRSLRFKSSYIYEDIFLHDEICLLNRAEARAIEKRLLLDTEEFKYKGKFLADSESKERFEGHSELREKNLKDDFVIDLIKKYLVEIQNIGWIEFWLKNNPGNQESSYKNKIKSS